MSVKPQNPCQYYRYLAVIFGCLIMTGLAACASGARTGAMVVPVSPDQIISDTSPIKSAITVGKVDGGSETNPLWKSNVSNANFKTALDESIALSALKAKTDARYTLDAQLLELDQPIMGFDMTVTGTVRYTLLPIDKTVPVFNETIKIPYTANFSDAFVAVERLRLANEGAIRENIKEFLKRIIAAAEPGGPLSNSRPVKTSLLQ